MNIPFYGLDRQYNELKAELLNVTDLVLSSGMLMDGAYVNELETWLVEKTGFPWAITVHSGTQALEMLALFYKHQHRIYYDTLGIRNPRINIPNLTYPATLNAFLSTGWDVSLIDTDITGIIDRAALDSRAHKTCVVGLYGKSPIEYLEHSPNNRHVIFDGAQDWLAYKYNMQHGYDVSMAISFDSTKNLSSTGNGGAVLTNSYEVYSWIEAYKNNGKRFNFSSFGTNSKMSELDCAHTLIRSNYIAEWQEKRTAIAKYWIHRFRNLPIRCLNNTVVPHTHQKFVLCYPENRNGLKNYLMDKGITTRIHYDNTLGNLAVSKALKKPDAISISDTLSRSVLSLPIYPELTLNEIDYIADIICKYKFAR